MISPLLDSVDLTGPKLRADLPKLKPSTPVMIAWVVLICVIGFTYSSQLNRIVQEWREEADYGHCWFVPLFSLVLLWVRREMIIPLPEKGSWWGIPFLLLWAALWWFSAYFSYNKTVPLSLIPLLLGIALLLGGWRGLRWAWAPIVFLVFMVPLPDAYSYVMRRELQGVATKLSVFVIQTLGMPCGAQGNVIKLPATDLEVARACSGLRMLMLFFAICVGAAFVMRIPTWQKIVAVVSAVPIAIVANVVRLTLTAVGHHFFGEHLGEIIHEWAGLLMMVVGMLLLWAEMTLLDRLVIEPPADETPLVVGERSIG